MLTVDSVRDAEGPIILINRLGFPSLTPNRSTKELRLWLTVNVSLSTMCATYETMSLVPVPRIDCSSFKSFCVHEPNKFHSLGSSKTKPDNGSLRLTLCTVSGKIFPNPFVGSI